MNELNPIEDKIIEENQSKQTPTKFELNNRQINRLKSGKILNNKKSLLNLMEKNFRVMKGTLFHQHYLLITKLLLEDLLSTIDLEVFFLPALKSLMHYWKLGKMNTKNQM